MKFLLIDDDKDFCFICEEMIKDEGIEGAVVVVCNSVEAALKAINGNQPDVVFLDHQLTRKGDEGLVVARFLKEHRPQTKVYSTTSLPDAIDEYRKMGYEHIEKRPGLIVDLIKKLSQP